MKILAVDDRKDDLYLLQKMLEGRGYEAVPAENGKEALKKLKEFEPDMVISDILMPGMDGYQLLKEIKSSKKFRKIPFVFYTATYTSKQDEEFAYALGASRFIVKPQEPETFLGMIEKTIKDVREGILTSPEPKHRKEEVYLKEYNERLIQKLEETVTKLEKARDGIKGSKEFMEHVLDSVTDGFIFIDSEGKVSLANQKGKLLQKEALKRVEPEFLAEGECTCDFELLIDERYYDPQCSSVVNGNNTYLGSALVLRDVTERKNIEEDLKVRVEELEKWQRLTVGRELKMIELKKRIKELEKEKWSAKKPRKKK